MKTGFRTGSAQARQRGFLPGAREWLSSPYFLARRGLGQALVRHRQIVQGKVLDFGCGSAPYRSIFSQATQYVGADVAVVHATELSGPDVVFDGKSLPFGDASFDSVLSTQTLEHVFEPQVVLQELNRVLRPGGHLLLTVPLMWGEHEMPYDFARYTRPGMRFLLEAAGFEVIEQECVSSGMVAVLQLALADVAALVGRFPPSLARIALVLVSAPINSLGLLLGKAGTARGNPIYLDQVVISTKLGLATP